MPPNEYIRSNINGIVCPDCGETIEHLNFMQQTTGYETGSINITSVVYTREQTELGPGQFDWDTNDSESDGTDGAPTITCPDCEHEFENDEIRRLLTEAHIQNGRHSPVPTTPVYATAGMSPQEPGIRQIHIGSNETPTMEDAWMSFNASIGTLQNQAHTTIINCKNCNHEMLKSNIEEICTHCGNEL